MKVQSQHEKPLDSAASQATSGSANPRYQSKSVKQLESENGKKPNSESESPTNASSSTFDPIYYCIKDPKVMPINFDKSLYFLRR